MHVNSRERLRSDGSVAKTGLPTQGARAPFLVREQDNHMPQQRLGTPNKLDVK